MKIPEFSFTNGHVKPTYSPHQTAPTNTHHPFPSCSPLLSLSWSLEFYLPRGKLGRGESNLIYRWVVHLNEVINGGEGFRISLPCKTNLITLSSQMLNGHVWTKLGKLCIEKMCPNRNSSSTNNSNHVHGLSTCMLPGVTMLNAVHLIQSSP